VGHPTPIEDDPTGQRFTFEAGANKQAGGQGWADVWKRGFFAWEYKGKHADLEKAYQQLLQYREALENPYLLVVSDMEQIVIHTNFSNTVKRVETLTLDDLLDPARLAILKAVFFDPEQLRSAKTTEQVTAEAAAEFSKLAELLRKYGEDPHRAAHFLIRLLFCLFAEDIELLPPRLFTRLINQTGKHTTAFTNQLRNLFGEMATGGWFGADQIKQFDGGLFDDNYALELDSRGIEILVKVSSLDWSSIEPSILGTLFERSLDPDKRSQLGAHYTSKEDILLIVEPVLMAPLRRRWEAVKAEAEAKAEARDQAKGRQRQYDGLHAQLSSLLLDFAQELSQVRVLDPASGSGNFLYVALKQLLDLWKEVSVLAGELGLSLLSVAVAPSPEQLYGIELNPYAHELAQATVWIGYIQWLRDNGFGAPSEPILKPLHNIVQMDAILAYDENGQPVEPAWPAADIIIGNPPFLGDKKMRGDLGDKYVNDLRKLYIGRIPGQSDLVCYWFEKARTLVEELQIQRVGLLATNSIRGGANRVVLDRIKEIGDIFWAQSNRDWILEGAAVNVSMVGFDKGEESHKSLDGREVNTINPDLTSSVDVTTAKTLQENLSLCFIGTQKTGPFDISNDQAEDMLITGGNPNGLPNSNVVRPWVNALDITNRPRQMWIIYFGINTPLDEASQYEKPFEYIKEHVKPFRETSRQQVLRERWWLFEKPRPAMYAALKDVNRYILTPRVSKYRLFTWMDSIIVPDTATVVITRSDDYFLGVLHSKPHELWALRQGTALEDRPRYTPTTTFETFPFPWPPGQEPQDDPHIQAIAQAARELVEKRDNWLNPPGATETELKKRTLTNLYNQRPTWLTLAHEKLDRAVFAAYAWPYPLSEEDILERLLALNLERAKVSGAAGKAQPEDEEED
jgi:type II restriction/modification system DNA methylase subunit YeeA